MDKIDVKFSGTCDLCGTAIDYDTGYVQKDVQKICLICWKMKTGEDYMVGTTLISKT